MIYKNKTILLLSFLMLIVTLNAQVGSPYTQYGFGNDQNRGYEKSKAMGGIGIGMSSSNNLNNLNPASYASFDSLSIIYAFGLNTGFNNIKTSTDTLNRTDTRFGYFALGFKGNKYWASSFGLTPYTVVDYSYSTTTYDDVNGYVDYFIYGSGGLNKIFWSNAFQITPNLSVGINASYIFGAINKVSTVFFVSDFIGDEPVYLKSDNTKIKRTKNIYDFTLDYGVQYKFDLKDNSKLILGAVYKNKMKLRSKESLLGGTISNNPNTIGDDFYKDIYSNIQGYELVTTIVDTTNIKSSVTLPSSYGFGFTYSHKDKLLVGVDVVQEMWSSVEEDFSNATYKNLFSVHGGLQYTPDYNSVNYYYKRINYRFGGHFTNSHLQVKDTRIKDYGISFGVGLPMRNSKTSFNIAAEFGQRGSLDQNLLQETYGIISLNISLSDIWFVKRKFK